MEKTTRIAILVAAAIVAGLVLGLSVIRFGSAAPGTPLSHAGWRASASESGHFSGPGKAVDGDISSRWTTGRPQAAGQWFQLDLGAPRAVRGLVLDAQATGPTGSGQDYPRAYAVYVSNDGAQWGRPVAEGKGNGPVTTITFAPQTARYVRIVQTSNINRWWWSIHEINVYS